MPRWWVLPSPLLSCPAPSSYCFGGDPAPCSPQHYTQVPEISKPPIWVKSRTPACSGFWGIVGPASEAISVHSRPRICESPMLPHCGPHGSGQGWLASALPLAPPKFDSWTCAPSVPTEPSADLHCSRVQGPVGIRVAPPLLGLRLLQADGREPRPHMSQPLRRSSRGSRPASGLTLCGFPLCDGGYRPAPRSGRTGLDGSRVYRGLSTWHLQALDSARTAGVRASGQAGDPGLSQGERAGQGGRKGTV